MSLVSRSSDESAATGEQAPVARVQGPARYLMVLVGTIVAAACLFVALLTALDTAGLKPPPAFTNSYCIDAKLEFLRKHPPAKITHLVIGSSIAWRNIDTAAIVQADRSARPLNGAFCGLAVNQSVFAAEFLIDRLTTVSQVLLVVDPFDMSNCRASKTAVFDQADVAAYLSGKSDLDYYFKYFDPISLVANALGHKEVFTPYGDGPLDTDRNLGLVYGPPPRTQPECLAALSKFAAKVERRGIGLTVITMPLMSDWSRTYDPDGRERKALARQLDQALAGTHVRFQDTWSAIDLPLTDYTDAVHLRAGAAARFTRKLVAVTGFGTSD